MVGGVEITLYKVYVGGKEYLTYKELDHAVEAAEVYSLCNGRHPVRVTALMEVEVWNGKARQ